MEENYKIKDAQLDAKADELLAYLSKWNMTARETQELIYRIERKLNQKQEKVLLANLLKQMK